MSLSLRFYLDAALTQPVGVEAPAALGALVGGGNVERRIWLGSVESGRVFRDLADPGAVPIVVSVLDADPASGQSAASVRLALTQAALDAATPGAPLAVGAEIMSGVANALAFWLRWSPEGSTAGAFNDIALETSDVLEALA
jgi:hypothetical protein